VASEIATSLFNGQRNRTIQNEATKKAIGRAISIGWRRSADRTRLQANSLVSGNFTGNFAILVSQKPISLQETAVLQRLLAQFPAQINRENISKNREFLAVNREFHLAKSKKQIGKSANRSAAAV